MRNSTFGDTLKAAFEDFKTLTARVLSSQKLSRAKLEL